LAQVWWGRKNSKEGWYRAILCIKVLSWCGICDPPEVPKQFREHENEDELELNR